MDIVLLHRKQKTVKSDTRRCNAAYDLAALLNLDKNHTKVNLPAFRHARTVIIKFPSIWYHIGEIVYFLLKEFCDSICYK